MVTLSIPGFAGLGVIAVPTGRMIVSSCVVTTVTGDICLRVSLPFSAPEGTFTTICVARLAHEFGNGLVAGKRDRCYQVEICTGDREIAGVTDRRWRKSQ